MFFWLVSPRSIKVIRNLLQIIHLKFSKLVFMSLSVDPDLMSDQLKDSLLNSKIVSEDLDELHNLWRVLEMPFGPQQKTPTRLLKPQTETDVISVKIHKSFFIQVHSKCTHCLLAFPISSSNNFHLGRPNSSLEARG